MNKHHIELANHFWKNHLQGPSYVLDATCGNGYDTLNIAKILLPHSGSSIIALDIQDLAIQNTTDLLKKTLPSSSHIHLKKISHSDFEPDHLFHLIVYNLGYLPKSDKTITTLCKTTFESINKALHWLHPHGAISIMCYPGHDEGRLETECVLNWAKKLNKEQYLAIHYQSINRENSPCLLWIKALQ